MTTRPPCWLESFPWRLRGRDLVTPTGIRITPERLLGRLAYHIAMDLDADILPGRSIAGLTLGEDALELIVGLQQQCSVKERRTNYPSSTCYEVDEAVIVIVNNVDFKIIDLAAMPGYRGRLYGYIRAGMSVRELIAGASSALLKHIHLYNEILYLDRAESVGFLLPPEYDDIGGVDCLPDDLALNALYVWAPAREQVRGRDGKLIWQAVG